LSGPRRVTEIIQAAYFGLLLGHNKPVHIAIHPLSPLSQLRVDQTPNTAGKRYQGSAVKNEVDTNYDANEIRAG